MLACPFSRNIRLLNSYSKLLLARLATKGKSLKGKSLKEVAEKWDKFTTSKRAKIVLE